jgi:hypothetical protein
LASRCASPVDPRPAASDDYNFLQPSRKIEELCFVSIQPRKRVRPRFVYGHLEHSKCSTKRFALLSVSLATRMAATTRAGCDPSSNTSTTGSAKAAILGPAAAPALAAAGGLSRSSSRARGGGYRAALSFAGLADKLSQLRGERRSAIYGFLLVPLALEPLFYIVN